MASAPRSRALGIALLATFAFGCADGSGPTGLSEGEASASTSQAGTTLKAAKTATGFHERRIGYDWSIEKRVRKIYGEPMELLPSTSTAHLSIGRSIWIYYEIDVTRTAKPAVSATGVRGTVCVENGGERPTEGLAITDVVQAKSTSGQFTDVASVTVDVSARPVLGPGETFCYPYEVLFDGEPGIQYRNTARVTITNHSGHLGTPFGPAFDGEGVKADFTIPASTTQGSVNATAIVDDGMHASYASRWWERAACAENFYLFLCGSANDAGYWRVSGNERITFIADMQNRAACGQTFPLTNVATLTAEGATGAPEVRVDSATVLITTDACTAPDQCVRDWKWWEQTEKNWPNLPDEAEAWFRGWPFFDTGLSWQQLLETAASGDDAYRSLAREYIAATLNMAKGVDAPQAAREARSKAARYFSQVPALRAATDAATLDQWAAVLRSFNTGALGVPSCAGD